ncbi:MAG: leucine-rich repeat protein [Acutalibacteraceae bacterium]
MRKTNKRILASVLTAVMILTATPLSGFVGLDIDFSWLDFGTEASALDSSGSCGDDVTYTFDADTGLITINGTGAMQDYYGEESPFYNNDSINSIIISDGVTKIGNFAFSDCTGLINITIPDSVTSIGDWAFNRCTGLTNITIPDSVTSIGTSPFSSCDGLESINVDVNNTVYDSRDNCNAIIETETNSLIQGCKNTEIPNCVTSIGWSAFEGCTGLTSITIPDSVTSIGGYAFDICTGLSSLKIGRGVTIIDDGAFLGCSDLISVTIPDSVKSIGVYAFEYCGGLSSITIPDSVTSIGRDAFNIGDDTYLLVYKNSYAEQYSIDNRLNYRIISKIPEDTDTVSGEVTDSFLWSVDKITGTLTLDCNGTMISFENDVAPWITYEEYIKRIIINDGCTNISKNAFMLCNKVEKVSIPESVTNIDNYAFFGCTGLKELTMPCSAKINNSQYVFYNCTNIEKLILEKGTGTMQDYSTSYSSISATCHQYTPWYISREKLKEIVIEDGVQNIGSCAFYDCTGLTIVTISDSVTSIDNNAFYNCYGLKELTMPCSAKIYNSKSTFYNCKNIKKVTLTKGSGIMQNFGSSTDISSSETYYGYTPWFVSSINLNEVVIEDGVMNIGDRAFFSCNELINLTIPDSVTSIGYAAFLGCNKLTSIKIGESITRIGGLAFNSCYSVTSIIVDSNNTVYDSRDNCNAIIETETNTLIQGCKNTTIPDSVTSIGEYAFEGYMSLTKMVIPYSVNSIGKSAFANCNALSELIIYNRNFTFADNATSKKTTIYGFTGSTAETYANEKGLSFIAIDDTHIHIPDNDATVTAPTCTEQGYTTYICSLCGESYIADYTEPLNHPHKTWRVTKNPTATSTGLMIETCDLCGAKTGEMEIPMLIPNYVTGITVSPNNLALNVGDTANITALITPDTAENKNVIWSSSDTDIATVSDGVVTANTPGVAVIIAQTEDGGYKDICVVRVASLTSVNGAVVDNKNGLIYGISSNSADINSYVNTVDNTMTVECDSAILGTGSVVNIVKDDVIVDSYKIVVFGDVDGDGWYDGMDAVTVSCIANGLLTKDQIGEAAYMAADCNHDGVVDEFDVAILNQAGVLLANVDQTKTQEELAADSDYIEYLNLIDQNPTVEEEPEKPEQTQESDKTYESIFEMIIDFIKSVFEMLISLLLK